MPSPVPVAYVFYGQDEPSLRERLSSFLTSLGDPSSVELNTTRLEGKLVTIGDIESAARSVPFLADVRLVLVENLTEAANGGRVVIEQLSALIPTLPGWSRLAFVETGLEGEGSSGRQQSLKKLINVVDNDSRGRVLAFDPPRDLPRWIQERAAKHGVSIETSAAYQLADRIGGDLILADTELVKLATYAAGQRPIKKEDVELLTPYSAEANIFHMVDALGQRNGSVALNLLRQLLDSGDDPLRIFGMIARQYRMIIQMCEQLDNGQSVKNAAQVLGLKDFVADKVASQARQYHLEQLERTLAFLLDVDVNIKTGKIAPELALEELVVRLCRRT